MELIKNITIWVHLAVAAVLIFVVLVQKSKTNGFTGALTGGAAESFFSKNSGNTGEAIMRKITAICAVLFLITSVGLSVILK